VLLFYVLDYFLARSALASSVIVYLFTLYMDDCFFLRASKCF